MSALTREERLPRLQRAFRRRFHEREFVQPHRHASYYETAMAANGTLDALTLRYGRAVHDATGRARLSAYGHALLREQRRRAAHRSPAPSTRSPA